MNRKTRPKLHKVYKIFNIVRWSTWKFFGFSYPSPDSSLEQCVFQEQMGILRSLLTIPIAIPQVLFSITQFSKHCNHYLFVETICCRGFTHCRTTECLKVVCLESFLYVSPAEFSNKCHIHIHFIVFAIT
jgi:hypothetical protein